MPGVQSRLLNPADHVTVPLEAPAELRRPAALHPAPPCPGTPICLPARSPDPVLSAPGSMQKDGDGGSLVGVAHLFVLATAWGMQVWVTFISGFVLARGVGRHVFGQVQSKLFPWYFHTLLGCSALNLALAAAAGRPWHQLSSAETLQVWLFGGSLVLSGLNARWLAPATARATAQLQALERERGLGAERSPRPLGAGQPGRAALQRRRPAHRRSPGRLASCSAPGRGLVSAEEWAGPSEVPPASGWSLAEPRLWGWWACSP
ncbi:transmembrane protein 205 isoform X3 [Alligator sinensis]|uniref:Transmembrane protein 205 n=1 Tax=Alligator sinensis TaxID=38654 RepID=A0A3Q0GJY9_ALLSI|nr:transmembrane protein 205 isoform X3 [Alligator sinensis]